MSREPDRLCLVVYGTANRLANPLGGVRTEAEATVRIIALSGRHQANRTLLNQILDWDTTCPISLRNRHDKTHV